MGTRRLSILLLCDDDGSHASTLLEHIEAFGKYYDYCVVNQDVDHAGKEVEAIVTALRCSSGRRRALVENLLASFGGKD